MQQQIDEQAKRDDVVLVRGERGVGKELVARLVDSRGRLAEAAMRGNVARHGGVNDHRGAVSRMLRAITRHPRTAALGLLGAATAQLVIGTSLLLADPAGMLGGLGFALAVLALLSFLAACLAWQTARREGPGRHTRRRR